MIVDSKFMVGRVIDLLSDERGSRMRGTSG
jgi:hypothetical protein